jgi:hypothetical protein
LEEKVDLQEFKFVYSKAIEKCPGQEALTEIGQL